MPGAGPCLTAAVNAFPNEACIVSGVEFNVRRIRIEFFSPRQCAAINLCTSHCQWKHTPEKISRGKIKRDAWTLGRLALPGRPAARPPAQPLGRPTAQPAGSPAARSPGRPAARLHGRQAVVRPPGRSAARPLIRLAARPPGRPAARPLGCTAARPSCGRPRPARPRIATQRFSPFLGSDPRTACSEPLRSVAARTATQ